jgi:predicted phage baseplate assembly protein
VPVCGATVAHGNVVPADHGITIDGEVLAPVPAAPPAPPEGSSCTCGTDVASPAPVPRYHPQLNNAPLTFSPRFDGFSPAATGLTSAAAFLAPDPNHANPQISLKSSDAVSWMPLSDLLSSGDNDPVFVVEVERDDTAFLRFGDNQYGEAPEIGLTFTASYRVGNGSIGNIGRDTLGHVLIGPTFPSSPGTITAVRNPLAATGGVEPEAMNHIVQYAPFTYQSQLRCVTENDYGNAAAQLAGIRESRGTLRWTGSWYTAFVSIDPVAAITTALVKETSSSLNLLRMMGTDLSVEGAELVGLRIEMEICVAPDHFQGDVYEALMHLFITGSRCDGQLGVLNAAYFSFGETVYASPLIAAAQSVQGVLAAKLTVFARMDAAMGTPDGVAAGYLTMGRLEIPRCDNDPNHLDHGIFVLYMDGGK